jgi:hypothetical protein
LEKELVMKKLFMVACALSLTTIVSFSEMCYFEAKAFEAQRAYEEAINELEAYQRTEFGNIDNAFICRRK